jgi:thymidylate synthase (FAD)
MKLIKASFEILTKVDGIEILRAIELAGRTCYKSEDKITEDSAKEFVSMVLKKGHESVIEHQSVSVKIICDRGVSHEIVRHRIASYSQESTRYCNYTNDRFQNQITFILPNWIEDIEPGIYSTRFEDRNGQAWMVCDSFDESRTDANADWFWHISQTEHVYNKLIGEGWQPQQARSVLPNSLKTEIVCTFNLREWRHFFKLRTSKAAHPQMREIACPLLEKFKELIPVIFDGIDEG